MKLFLNILLIIAFAGCASTTLNTQYKMSREKKAFIDNLTAMGVIQIDKNSLKTITILPEAGNNIVFRTTIEDAKNIVAIELTETKNLNLNQLLIKEKEYFYDRKNHELLISFNMPYLYFLKGSIDIKTKILYLTKDKKIRTMNRSFVFKYKPMKNNGEDYLSYKYIDMDTKKLDNLDNINQKHIKEEIELIDKNRVSSSYRKLLNEI